MLAGVLAATCLVPLAVDPFGYNPFGPVKTFVLCVACTVILAGLALAPDLVTVAWPMVRLSLPAKLFGAFLTLTLVSMLVSIEPLQSLVGSYPEYQGVLALIAYLVVASGALALLADDAEGFFTSLGRALVATVLAVCFLAVLQRIGLDPIHYRWGVNLPRARSTLGNASNLGLYLVLAMPTLVERIRRERVRVWRYAAAGSVVLGVVVLVWTSSRGAWLGLAAAATAWLVLEAVRWSPRIRVRVAVAALGVAIIFVAAVGLAAPDVFARVASSADLSGGSERWRLSVWDSSMRAAFDRPVLGWGPNSLRFVYPLYRNADLAEDASDAQIVADAHNVFVNTAVERGLPASIALAAWLGALLLAAWRRRDAGNGSLALVAATSSLVAGLVALQFHFLTLDTGPLFFCVAGIVMFATSASAHTAGMRVSVASGKAGRRGPIGRGPVVSVALWAAAGIALTASVLGGALIAADRAIGRGMALAESGAPWTEVAAPFRAARRYAPWEPAAPWAEGRAAVGLLQRRTDEAALAEGRVALEVASKRLRHETRLEADHADLVLAAGLAMREEGLFAEALDRYDTLISKDPNNGVLWIGRGSALAGLGRWQEAVTAYERGTGLAQRSIPGWLNLAVAYEQSGRDADARSARERAAAIIEEDRARGAPEGWGEPVQ